MNTSYRYKSPYYFDNFFVSPVGCWTLEGYDDEICEQIDPRDIQKTLNEGANIIWTVYGHILHDHPKNGPIAGGDDAIADYPTEAEATAAYFQILATLNSQKGNKMKTTDMKRIIADDDQKLLLCNENKVLYWLRRQWYRLQLRLSWRVTIFIILMLWGFALLRIADQAPV